MLIVLSLLLLTQSIKTSRIPSTGTPPESCTGSAAVYDEKTNTIITIGGERISDTTILSDVYFFNLTSNTWSSPRIISDYEPKGMRRHRAYMRKDRKIIIIGAFKEIILFDIDDFSWSYEELKGDNLFGIYSFGMAGFTENEVEYIAIFGGSTLYSYSNNLYL